MSNLSYFDLNDLTVNLNNALIYCLKSRNRPWPWQKQKAIVRTVPFHL